MFLGRLFALLAALASSGTPLFAQTLRDAGWSPWQASAARSAIGFMLLALWLRRDLLLVRNDMRGTVLFATNVMLGTTSYLFAAMHASAGTAVCVLYLSTAWVTLWQRWRGTPERYDLPATAMVVSGVACVVGFGGVGDTWQGIAAALFSSVSQSVFTVLGSRLSQKVPAPVLAAAAMFGGALAFGWLLSSAPWGAPHAAAAALSMGVVSGMTLFLFAALAFRRIGVETRMWFPFDLVFVWTAQTFWQGHVPAPASVIGVLLIFSAATLLAYGKRQTAAQLRPSS